MNKERLIGGTLLAALIVLVGVGLWRIHGTRRHASVIVIHRPRAVMGTSCMLAVVVPVDQRARAETSLREAEQVLRTIEARMSRWLADSEISRLNSTVPGRLVPLSPETLNLLRTARRATLVQTDGAFNPTCGPLVELWRRAADQNTLPQEAELAQAMAASSWESFELLETGAQKRTPDARLDLGGIAKGYAIDRAVERLREAGFDSGLVDVGGDLRCFGHPPNGAHWPVDVQNPFDDAYLMRLEVSEVAVATSGNYARYVEIQGQRHGHIIDPRSGRPTQAAQSVTVIASEAMDADIWATALAVLGPEGLTVLPKNVEAIVVTGSRDDFQIHGTPGSRALMAEPSADTTK